MRELREGTRISYGGTTLTIRCDILEGHRFAVQTIDTGEYLLSWGMPFGKAVRPIRAGEWLRNKKTVDFLSADDERFERCPPNFDDEIPHFNLKEIETGRNSVVRSRESFKGFRRDERGSGTRNYIAVIAATAATAGFVRELALRCSHLISDFPNIDGIVPIAHTEGTNKNNAAFTLRALAGFVVHPNIGGSIIADYGADTVSNDSIKKFMEQAGYPLRKVPHHFLSIEKYDKALEDGKRLIIGFLDKVNSVERVSLPVSELKVALQCGGSDAFSGITANPLLGLVSKHVVRAGGCANLGETLELLGAEQFVVSKVRSRETAEKFLAMQRWYEERASWHNVSGRSNPSSGNMRRGLTNIYLKSLGAAMKKHPDIFLDYVIDYAELMNEPGYYFMNSPGNDLESIGGQAAAGSNIIFFTTGNGSTSQFPFVPTIKLITTTGRYTMMSDDMDYNAGKYLDGVSMETMEQELFDRMLKIASGDKTAAEKSGRPPEIQLWRGWHDKPVCEMVEQEVPENGVHNAFAGLDTSKAETGEEGAHHHAAQHTTVEPICTGFNHPFGKGTENIALIVPTSLCATGQSLYMADILNKSLARQYNVRFTGLYNTEGCGSAGDFSHNERTLANHALHPNVVSAFFVSLGCEKTGPSALQRYLQSIGVNPEQFGWARIQSKGGSRATGEAITRWFESDLKKKMISRSEKSGPIVQSSEVVDLGWSDLLIGVALFGEADNERIEAIREVVDKFTGNGTTVVVPEKTATSFFETEASLKRDFGERINTGRLGRSEDDRGGGTGGTLRPNPRLSIMTDPSIACVETLTGLAACGAHLTIAYTAKTPLPNHPLMPVIQTTDNPDLFPLPPDFTDITFEAVSEAVRAVLTGKQKTAAEKVGNVNFQLPRGNIFSM